MRTQYVIPLQGKIAARIEVLANEVSTATSATPSAAWLGGEVDAAPAQWYASKACRVGESA